MEISLKRKEISIFREVCSTEQVFEQSCEIVVPDTKEDIAIVLLSDAAYKLRSKDIEDGKVKLKIDLEYKCAFVPESGVGIQTLNSGQTLEYELAAEGSSSENSVVCEIKIVSIETKVLNPRKIMIRIKLHIRQCCYEENNLVWYEKPEEAENNVFFKTEEQNALIISYVDEKTFSLDNEFEMAGLTDSTEIISAKAKYFADSSDAVGSKLIVKGHAEVEILYITEGKLEHALRSTAFSQLFELPERDTMPNITASILPTGDFYELNGGMLCCELHAVMQIVCRENKKFSFVSDAYACRATSEVQYENNAVCTGISNTETTESVRLSGNAGEEVSMIEYSSVNTGLPEKNDTEIKLPIYADVVYSNKDGAVGACRIKGAVKLPYSGGTVYAALLSSRLSSNGDEVILNADIKLTEEFSENAEMSSVSAVVIEKDETEGSCPSLYICRMGEDIWELAKKYGSDPELIVSMNGIGGDSFETGRLIMIPKL